MLHVFDENFAQTLSSQTHTRDETKTPTQTKNLFIGKLSPIIWTFYFELGGGEEERYRYYFLLKSLNMFTIQKLD